MSQSTRFPLLEDLELRSATEDKDGVVSNIFYDKEGETLYAVKRPGLTSYLTGSGQGSGVYGWGDQVFSFYGQILILDTFDGIGGLYTNHISNNNVSWTRYGTPHDSEPIVEGGDVFLTSIGWGGRAQVISPVSTGYIKAIVLYELLFSATSIISIGWAGSSSIFNSIICAFKLTVAADTTSTIDLLINGNSVQSAPGPNIDFGTYYSIELDITSSLINLYITDPYTLVKTSYLLYVPTVDITGLYPVFNSSGGQPHRISYFEAGNLNATIT